jgi:hypothetical protein
MLHQVITDRGAEPEEAPEHNAPSMMKRDRGSIHEDVRKRSETRRLLRARHGLAGWPAPTRHGDAPDSQQGRQTTPRRGRPKGSTVPFERDRQRFTIGALWGFRFAGAGPYTAAYWAAYVTGEEPMRPEDIEGLLIAAGTKIKHTASTLEKHLDHLARKADRIPPDSDVWLKISAVTIKALILAARTGNLEIYCLMLDLLIDLGWANVIKRRRINEALKSNVPPYDEGELGLKGPAFLARLRMAKKR